MRYNLKGILFIITVVIILGCNTIEPKDINIELLNKEWVHSREEEKDSILVYRPIDYKEFPTSRYRQMYFFADSGSCKYYVLSPYDAHYFEEGTWEYKEDEILNIFNPQKELIISYKIITLKDNLLELLQLN